MTKTTTIGVTIAAAMISGAITAHAQTPSTTPAESKMFVSVSGGGQLQERTLSTNDTITVFGENGVVTANQTVGSGFVFDINGGIRVWRKVSVGIGVSTFTGQGDAAAVAAIPDRLVFGKFTNVNLNASDLKQSDIATNFLVFWPMRLSEQFDLMLILGPSLIHVTQDILSVSVDQSTGAATAVVNTQSATTAKAGTGGVDLIYKFNPRYQAGIFARYLGGEVDLPSASKMKIGGFQLGAGLRYRF